MQLMLLPSFIFGAYTLLEKPRVIPRVDHGLGVVFLEKWQGDLYLGIEKVVPISEYLGYSIKEAVLEAWQKSAQKVMRQRELAAEPTGLIPDIELPKLPVLGEGSKIDIAGSDRITLGGSRTVVKGATRTLGGQSPFPELKMEQQLAINVNGTIGERTKITIDHNSEREEQQNKIKLQYTGTEDDVVQSVELGDTRLDIPGTIFTGDLPVRQGLFGISAKGKVAGADVYAIASREGSQSQSQSFTGKRRVMVDTIWDIDFVQRRFFRLPNVDTNERLVGLRVYIDDRNSGNNQAAIKAIATVFPDNPDSIPGNSGWWSYDRTGGDFDLKTPGVDYIIQPGNVLEFLTAIERNYIIGVVIYKENETIGGYNWRDSLVLCMLKPEVTDSLSRTWDLHLRNTYQLRQSEVKLNTVSIYRYNPQGQNYDYETDSLNPNFGIKFVQILGLDPDGDGKVDYPQFEGKTGIIRFPEQKPFASAALSLKDSIIYKLDPSVLPPGEGRRYFILVSYYTSTETYYLGQTDIIEGSERVFVNAQQKTRNSDYTIDYKTGILTFLVPLPPDADVNVTFEYQPWFSLAQKSLVGSRLEWSFLDNGKLGSSFFYRDEGVREEKPILGSEPFQRTIIESDISYRATSDKLTAFLDRLPLLSAQSPSQFDFKTEGAVSLSNPNTRGIVYLDDFEGTTITREIYNTAMLWSFVSVPVGKDTATFARTPLRWNNPAVKIRKDSVFGPNIGDEASETQEVLRIFFAPDNTLSWAGMMQSPPGAQIGMNFVDMENLEIIIRSRRGRGNIHVSVGMAIDEDAPRRDRNGMIRGYNGVLDTEDKNGNGVLDEWEDTGLDGVAGLDSLWTAGSEDEGNDDYDPVINPQGTEGNRRLDSEDLDGNGFSRYNHYFEYTIPLGDERISVPLFNGWRLYRISLRDSSVVRKVGTPKWEDIRVIRLWMDGFDGADTLEVYSFQFVGSKWRNPQIVDSSGNRTPPGDTLEKAWIGQVSRKTDTTYTSPFELKRDITGKLETEAALLFGYKNLAAYHQAFVTNVSNIAEDYREYEQLRFYVHDDGNGLECIFRFGSDSANFYEFKAPIASGKMVPWGDGKWFEFIIHLDSLPILKLYRDSLNIAKESLYTRDYPGYSCGVKGVPSLGGIRWTVLGIRNPKPQVLTGAVWFNDIRLIYPKKEPGYGFTAQTSIQLADFISAGLRYSYSDPNFRRFSEGRGVKTGGFGQNLSTNVSVNLDRLLPRDWKINAPLSYSFARQHSLPKFSPLYSDLRLVAENAKKIPSSGCNQEISLTNLSKQKSTNKLLNYTVEAMNFSWSRRWASSHNYPFDDSSNSTAWRLGYGVNPDFKITLGKDKELYPLPRDVRWGITREYRTSIRWDTVRVDTVKGSGLAGDFNIGFSPIEDLTFEYGWDSERDFLVSNPDRLFAIPIGTEASRSENFGVSYELDVGEILNPSIEFTGEYNHERPKSGYNYVDYLNINNSSELSLNTTLELGELLERLDRTLNTAATGKRTNFPNRPGDNQARGRKLNGNAKEEEVEDTDSASAEESTGAVSRDLSGSSFSISKLKMVIEELARNIEPFDVSYTISRSSEYLGLRGSIPWHYRLGLVDTFSLDSIAITRRRTRDFDNNLRFSTGGGYKNFSVRMSYDLNWGKNRALVGTTADRSLVWPNLSLNINKIHGLFAALATDSRLSSNYRRTHSIRGELIPVSPGRETLAFLGRNAILAQDFSPLLSWQTTWKKRISTNASINYNHTSNISYLSGSGIRRSKIDTKTRAADFSLSYSFSAPQGLKIPFLQRVRFSSDLSVSWQLRYSQTLREQAVWTEAGEATIVPQQRDNAIGTNLGASYRFSRTIEAGLNTGYSYNRGITGLTTQRTDVNIWLLLRF